MTFKITPNEENQCFNVIVSSPRGITAHHVATADLFAWFHKIIVDCNCEVTVKSEVTPRDTPEPRYLILSGK